MAAAKEEITTKVLGQPWAATKEMITTKGTKATAQPLAATKEMITTKGAKVTKKRREEV